MGTIKSFKSVAVGVTFLGTVLVSASPAFAATTTTSSKNQSSQFISPSDAQQVSDNEFQKLLQQHLTDVQTPAYQSYLTQLWESKHSISTLDSSAVTNSSSISPDVVLPPVGAIQVVVSYDNDPSQYYDNQTNFGSYYAAEGVVYSAIVGSVKLSDIAGTVVYNCVTSLFGSFINIQKADPVTTGYWHSFRYGYKDVEIWNGSTWVDWYTTTDREWWAHAVASWTNDNNKTSSQSIDYNSSPIRVDYASTWSDSDSELGSLAEDYQALGRHGYDFYPGY